MNRYSGCLTIAIVGVLAIVTVLYLLQVESKQLVLLARDWELISFSSNVEQSRSQVHSFVANHLTGGGVIDGQTQYFVSRVTNFPDPPPTVEGGMRFSVDDVWVTVIDVSDWLTPIDFDPGSELYYVLVGKQANNPNYEPSIAYRPPFQEIPWRLSEEVVYRSAQPEALTLSIPESLITAEVSVQVLTNEPTFWGWDLRRGCDFLIENSTDLISFREKEIVIFEECPTNRALSTEAARTDQEARIEIADHVFLVRPSGYRIHTPGLGDLLSSQTDKYLLLVQSPDNLAYFAGTPADNRVLVSVYPASTPLYADSSFFQLKPTARSITLLGPSGTLAVGRDTIVTDEVSQVTIHYAQGSWPTLSIDSESTVQESGDRRISSFLTGRGTVDSLLINGEQLVPNRWHTLPPDVQGGIIGAIIAAFFTTVGWLLSSVRWSSNFPPSNDLGAGSTSFRGSNGTSTADKRSPTVSLIDALVLLLVLVIGCLKWLRRSVRRL